MVASNLAVVEALKRKEVREGSGWKSSCVTRLLKRPEAGKPFQFAARCARMGDKTYVLRMDKNCLMAGESTFVFL